MKNLKKMPGVPEAAATEASARAYLEATQLAGFSDPEARQLFGSPPPDWTVRLVPLPPALAVDRARHNIKWVCFVHD